MRVLQLAINPDWIGKSGNPAQSAHAASVGGTVLLDDSWSYISTAELATQKITPTIALLLFSKDIETMDRCLRALSSRALEAKCECYVGVATWALGHVRYTSPLLAGALTVLNNIRVKTTSHGQGHQSVKKNMQAAGRDGRLIQNGCAVYLSATPMPPSHGGNTKFEWYTHRDSILNDGNKVTLGDVGKGMKRAVRG